MFRSIYLIIIILVFLTACAQHKPILKDTEYLELAEKHIADEEYKEARKAFEDLEANYPDSKYVAQARYKTAQTYFDEKHYTEAALQYIRFLRFHPRNSLAAEAQYQLGLSYFIDRLSIDRDPDKTIKALNAFNQVIEIYNDSLFVVKAEENKNTCIEELAEHEFYIGHFYFKMDAYEAAINRFQQLYLAYPQTKSAPKALYYLAESYQQLGNYAEANELFKLFLNRYPDHDLTPDAKERIN